MPSITRMTCPFAAGEPERKFPSLLFVSPGPKIIISSFSRIADDIAPCTSLKKSSTLNFVLYLLPLAPEYMLGMSFRWVPVSLPIPQSLVSIATSRKLPDSLLPKTSFLSTSVQTFFTSVTGSPIFRAIEWCDPLLTDSLSDSAMVPWTLSLSTTSSMDIFSTSSAMRIFTLSPLSGLAESFACFITRVVSPTLLSPALMTLRSVKRSSDSSGMRAAVASSIFFEINSNVLESTTIKKKSELACYLVGLGVLLHGLLPQIALNPVLRKYSCLGQVDKGICGCFADHFSSRAPYLPPLEVRVAAF